MAQLPPKAPAMMAPNWPFSMGKDVISPAWVDEFLDFSSVRRNSHRRSASDSIAFLPLLEDCPSGENDSSGGFDEEQIMSMFVNEVPDDENNNSNNYNTNDVSSGDQYENKLPKEEPQEEDDNTCKSRDSPPPAKSSDTTICDPKRVKRILANRQSAQRSRVRKLQYISELERSVTTLQTEVSALSPRVAFLDHQRLILNVDNSALKQRIAALMQDKIFKDAHQEALKKEIERLRQVYRKQNQEKTSLLQPTSDDDIGDQCTDKDQNIETYERIIEQK